MCRYRENPMDDHAQVGQFQGNRDLLLPCFNPDSDELRRRLIICRRRYLKSSEHGRYLKRVKECAGILWKLQTSSTAMKVGTA